MKDKMVLFIISLTTVIFSCTPRKGQGKPENDSSKHLSNTNEHVGNPVFREWYTDSESIIFDNEYSRYALHFPDSYSQINKISSTIKISK